jgi:hypothetical protein
MGILSAVFSGITGFLGPVIRTVGPVVGGLCQGLAKLIPHVVEKATEVLNGIGRVLEGVGQVLGIPPGDDLEEMGAKLTQEDTRPIQEGETHKAYMDYLRSVELDKERFERMSKEDKLGCLCTGVSLKTAEVGEAFGNPEILTPDFLMGVYKIGMSEMQIKNYVEKLSENGVKPETFAKFLDENEKCTEIENEKIYKAIEEAEKIENPNISDFEVQEKIDEMGEKFKKKLE